MVVMSFTASAAFLVNGTTIHSSLKFGQNIGFGLLKELKGDALNQFQKLFKHVKYIIFDEFSMIGEPMLLQID